MYMVNRTTRYNGLGQGPYDPYPGYSTDPAQVPIMPGFPYGIPGMGYPGYAFGQRTLSLEDAVRLAKEREEKMLRRATTTDNPAHKYVAPEGVLGPEQQALLHRLERKREAELQKKLESKLESKIITTALIGVIISALLR